MKNERVYELFSENIDRLYAAAKEKHGERAEEVLMDAVRKTAGKYKKLGEKAYITGLLQEVGASAFYEAEESAPYGLVEKLERIFAERYAAAQKKSRLFAILGGAVAAVCLAVAVGFALRPGAAPSGATTIEGAKEYTSGDFFLTNVHTVNDHIGFDGEFGMTVFNGNNEEQAASTVAPDGTVYMFTVCAVDTVTETDTYGLFRMTGEGWEEVCRIEQKAVYFEHPLTKERLKHNARNFIFCDAESRPIVFFYDIAKEMFIAYVCDVKTGKTEAAAEIPVQIGMVTRAYANITACADGDRIYFAACSDGSWVDILIFDLESREFRRGGEVMQGSNIYLNAIAHRKNTTYLLGLDSTFGGGQTLYLYAIKDIAEDTQELIFEKQLYAGGESTFMNNTNGAPLTVDDDGKAYVFFTCRENWQDSSTVKHVLEIVSAEGETLTSKRYSPIVKGNTSKGVFMGQDGNLYFMELANQQITVGAVNGADYGEIRKVASFQRIAFSALLRPQFISDPAGKDGVFIDLLGATTEGTTVIKYSYMRLQLKPGN